jgi:CHAD domain-containing protein
VLANVEGARLAYDAESLHQLRIGLRRLRAALSVYRELIPSTLRRSWAHRLRSLERGVSSARDWDALAEEIGNSCGGQADFGSLLREARVRQEKSHRDSRQVLGGAALTRIITEIGCYAADQSHASGTDEKSYEEQLLPFARRLLSLRDRKVRRAGRGLRKLKIAELHKLRIRIKKLRYAAEFFAGLWSKTASEPYLASLRGLQDELGLLQDATTGVSLLTVIERRRLKPSSMHMRARPERVMTVGSDLAAPQEIALGDNTSQPVGGIDHRQTADSVLEHHADRLGDAGVLAHSDDLRAHQLAGLHGPLLLLHPCRLRLDVL